MTQPDTEKTASAAEALAEYRRRRDFTLTAEPAGEGPAGGTESPEHPVFVIQKHAASSLHYDLRLELGGVLRSWAVPKGPSLDPADKRLAVMTEDHPLEYAAFEGTIPEGEYGGGTVMVWDFGWWEPDQSRVEQPRGSGQGAAHQAGEAEPEDPAAIAESALTRGELKFVAHGEKLSGSWTLVQMKNRGEKNWLLIKHRDQAARPGSDITGESPDSVATGRSIDQIAADEAG